MTMATKVSKRHFPDEFKEEVIKYGLAHPDESTKSIIQKFDIPESSYYKWKRQYAKNNGEIITRGSGNHSNDEAKEIARLKKELRDTQDALEVLKKAIGIVGR